MNHHFPAKHPYPPKCLDAQEPSFWGETLTSARTLTLGRNPFTLGRTPIRGEWQLGMKPPRWAKIAEQPKSLEQGNRPNGEKVAGKFPTPRCSLSFSGSRCSNATGEGTPRSPCRTGVICCTRPALNLQEPRLIRGVCRLKSNGLGQCHDR